MDQLFIAVGIQYFVTCCMGFPSYVNYDGLTNAYVYNLRHNSHWAGSHTTANANLHCV